MTVAAAEIKVTGDKELIKNLAKLITKSEAAAQDVVAKTALNIRKLAGLKVRRKTSRLATSITIAMKDKFSGVATFGGEGVTRLPVPMNKFDAIVGSGVAYAAVQEFTARGRPYLLPALNESRDFMKKALESEFKKLKP